MILKFIKLELSKKKTTTSLLKLHPIIFSGLAAEGVVLWMCLGPRNYTLTKHALTSPIPVRQSGTSMELLLTKYAGPQHKSDHSRTQQLKQKMASGQVNQQPEM